ncbi:MAG: ATP-binding protein [Planctomycetota bacterium]
MLERLRNLVRHVPFAGIQRGGLLSWLQLVTASVFLISVAVISVAMVRHTRSNASDQLVERGGTVSSIIAQSAGEALRLDSDEAARRALGRVLYNIRAEQGVEFGYVVDAEGQVLAHSDGRRAGEVIRPRPAGQREWAGGGLHYLTYPADDETTGAEGRTIYEFVQSIPLTTAAQDRYGHVELHVGFSLPGHWAFARTSFRRALPGLAIAFFLLVLGNYLASVFVRPLSRLRQSTAAAAAAPEEWQLEVGGSGEIAEIAQNWNQMVETFHTSYEKVVQGRRDLEVRNRVMLYEKKQTEAIVDSLADGVIVTDAHGKISFVNRECETLLGLERGEVVGKAPDEAVADEGVAEFLGAVVEPASTGGPAPGRAPAVERKPSRRRAAELALERANGTRHVRASYVPVVDNRGKPGGGIIVFRDVTQSKLEETARNEFLSSVTHELRAPLTAIKSYVEMLIDDEAKGPDLQREFFNTINEEADRLARLIDDMLNMSKIEVGNLVLNKSLVRTRKLLEDAVNGLRSAAKSKGIELSADIAEDLPDIEADKEMVRVVVTNLLGNGIKYTPEGGEVFLSAGLIADPDAPGERRRIAVAVEDNGPGIPADEQDKIFEKFYRGRMTDGQKVVGNGLGLALSREIATLHGGDIKLASTEGAGSKFTFVLPAAETSRKVS